jgi:hypothetical protein
VPATFTIPLITVIPGQVITATLWNNEYGNIYNNFVPSGMDDYSANDTQMQTATDPYPGAATSRPTSLQGEIERLRYQLANVTGKTYWYIDPDVDIATFKTRFDAHTHDGTSNQGPQLLAAGLASNAVTTAKITDANVTTAKIADLGVTNAKINDVAATKITGTIATAPNRGQRHHQRKGERRCRQQDHQHSFYVTNWRRAGHLRKVGLRRNKQIES